MLTKSDIADIISGRLERGSSACARTSADKTERAPDAPAPAPKRVFISDRELKRMFKEGQRTIELPANAIISPLSEDWLDYESVKIIRN